MSTDTTQRKPLTIARILLGQPYVITQPDSVMVPAVDVRVLAENGAMFKRTFLAFGLSKDLVRDAWQRDPEKFLKVELNPVTQPKTPSLSQPSAFSLNPSPKN